MALSDQGRARVLRKEQYCSYQFGEVCRQVIGVIRATEGTMCRTQKWLCLAERIVWCYHHLRCLMNPSGIVILGVHISYLQ